MDGCRSLHWSRREFLGGLTLAGTAGFIELKPKPAYAEPPPEITRIRLTQSVAICGAPVYLAQEFLPAEGFTEVQYVKRELSVKAIKSGEVDIAWEFSGPLLIPIDAGEPIVILGGIHVGCFELFGSERVRAIRDLKGKTVGISEMGGGDHVFLSSMVAYVGLNPRTDIRWSTPPVVEWPSLLTQGKLDAVLAFPPLSQEFRAKKIGHVIVNSVMDRPWSQYFCCMVYVHREFVRKYLVATKRVLRAILKGADLCARQPARAARFLVDRGFTSNYDYALRTMTDVVYGRWREYDHEDTLRFYGLRMQEAGMLKRNPKKLIAESTDWRFLNALKKELKA